jgi:predicted nucleic acid-binding protein
MHPAPALLDSSIYVSALRSEKSAGTLERLASGTRLWLSAVVLQELYAGAGDRQREVVERWERDFEQARRILVPSQSDWTDAGKALRLLATRYDYEKIGRGRLTNDALIAMSAARAGIRVITANEKDFRRLAEFRSFDWQLVAL